VDLNPRFYSKEEEAKMTSSTACWILVFVLFAALLVEPIVGPAGLLFVAFQKLKTFIS
jgi:hypothetical protein